MRATVCQATLVALENNTQKPGQQQALSLSRFARLAEALKPASQPARAAAAATMEQSRRLSPARSDNSCNFHAVASVLVSSRESSLAGAAVNLLQVSLLNQVHANVAHGCCCCNVSAQCRPAHVWRTPLSPCLLLCIKRRRRRRTERNETIRTQVGTLGIQSKHNRRHSRRVAAVVVAQKVGATTGGAGRAAAGGKLLHSLRLAVGSHMQLVPGCFVEPPCCSF